MGKPQFYKVTNQTETEVKAVQSKGFAYRFAYARSHDSQKEEEPGQDILILLENGNRLAFALCDGVSQSFFGDLAARILADALVDWLWQQREFDIDSMRLSLAFLLQKLTGSTKPKVAEYPIPDDLPKMVRSVLEQKRIEVGSASMFVAGLVDINQQKVLLAWLGDSRLRLWSQKQQEMTSLLGDTFHTDERWNSNKGAVGTVHLQMLPLDKAFTITAYSDGMSCLDPSLNPNLPNQKIQSFIALSGGDDDSFIQVSIGLMPKEWEEKVVPVPVTITPLPFAPKQPVPPRPLPPTPILPQPKSPARNRISNMVRFLIGLFLILFVTIVFVIVKYKINPPPPPIATLTQATETLLSQGTFEPSGTYQKTLQTITIETPPVVTTTLTPTRRPPGPPHQRK